MAERLFYRVTEIADLIGCSKTKAYELVASGAIPSVRIGGLLRVPAGALRKLAQLCDEDEGGEEAQPITDSPSCSTKRKPAQGQ